MSTDQQLLEQLRQVNPVPADAEPPAAMWSAAALFADVEQRSGKMKTNEDVREVTSTETQSAEPRKRWRGPLIAVATAVVALLIVGAGFWILADGSREAPVVDEPVPTTLVPELSSDLSNLGEALTAAHNADDPEVFLSMFAEDAELRFANDVITPDEIRTQGPLLGGAGHFQYNASYFIYDRTWARIFNERYDYSSCQINGDRALCDMTVTTDYLQPLLGSIPHTAAFQVRDGKIVVFVFSHKSDPSHDIPEDFQDWTQANYPEEAELMWVNDGQAIEVPTEESALLHLRLGEEYAQLQP